MNKTRLIFTVAAAGLLLGLAAVPAFSQTAAQGTRILQEIDRLSSFEGLDFSAVYTIVAQKPNEPQEVTQARLFRRDSRDQFLILILQPSTRRGQGYLQVEDNVLFYDPESRKFERSSLRQSIQGSDAQNDDLNQSSLADDYNVVGVTEGVLSNIPVYILDLKAKRSDVTYDGLKLWVRRDVSIILKQEEYSVNGRLLRTVLAPRYANLEGRYIPTQMLIVDEVNVGQRTQLTVTNPSVDPLPDAVFQRSYLERVNN